MVGEMVESNPLDAPSRAAGETAMILYCAPATPPTPCPQTARAVAEVQAKRVSLPPVLRKIMQNPVIKWEGKE
jgi:hypothetical protein